MQHTLQNFVQNPCKNHTQPYAESLQQLIYKTDAKTRIITCVGTHTDPDGNKTYPETYTFVVPTVRFLMFI